MKDKKIPAVIIYPPQYYSRTFYSDIIYPLVSRGIAVLLPNIKRTCREPRTLHLCDKEINGAIKYLQNIGDIDSDRIGIMFPSFYYLSAEQLIKDKAISVKTIIFMGLGRQNFGVEPEKILKNKNGYTIFHIRGKDFEKMIYLFGKSL